MINVTPDILKKLDIESCFLRYNEKDVWCSLWSISSEKWVVSLTEKISDSRCELFCKINNVYLLLPGLIRLIESEYMYLHEIIFENSNPQLSEKITNLEKLFIQSEKRKEKRFEVDLANYDSFGLISRQQAVYMENASYPCVVNNISYGGALITTVMKSQNYKPLLATLFLSFKNPIENVLLAAHIKHVVTKQQFMMLSLQFLENNPVYIERVIRYEKK